MLVTEIAIRGALVGAATLLVHGATRRQTPAARHAVLMVGLGLLAVLPAEVAVGPRWRPTIGYGSANPPSSELLQAMAAIKQSPGVSWTRPADVELKATRPAASRPNVGRFVLLVALLGALACIVARVAGAWRVGGLIARADPFASADPVTLACRDAADAIGLRRSYRIVQSKECTVPFVAGVLRPTVVIPRDFGAWPRAAIRAILVHELAHVRRRDVLARVVANVACALNWFNPLVWLCARRCISEAEYACDDAVVQAEVDANMYAKQLVTLARAYRGRRMFEPTVGVARTALGSRVERLLGARLAIGAARPPRQALATAALGALGMVSIGVTPRFAAPQFVASGPTTLNISTGSPEISSNAAGLQARWVVNGRHTGMFITGMVDLDDVLAGVSLSDGGSLVIAQETGDGLVTYEWPNGGSPPAWVRESLRLASGQLRRLAPLQDRDQTTPRAVVTSTERLPGSMLFGTTARSDDPAARVIQAGWVENERRFGVFMRGRWETAAGRLTSDDAIAWVDAFVWDARGAELTRVTITRSPRGELQTRSLRGNQVAVPDADMLAWAARLVDHVNAASEP